MGRGSPNLRKNTAFLKKHLESTQSIEIWEQNAWVCDDMIFKTRVLSPNSQKQNFLHSPQIFKQQINFAQNSKYLQNLVGQTINTHNNMYKV